MKVKDLIKDDFQSKDWWVYDSVMSKIDFSKSEYDQVMALPEALKNTYIAHTFLDELNSGGLDYYYDSSAGVFAKHLFEIFTKFSFESNKNMVEGLDHEKLNHLEVELLEAINLADETVAKIEARLGFSINDNIEHITDDESEILMALNDRICELNSGDILYGLITRYVACHLEDEI